MSFYQKSSKKQAPSPLEPIPIGESVETDWSAWEELVAMQNNPGGHFQATEHSPIASADGQMDAPSGTGPR